MELLIPNERIGATKFGVTAMGSDSQGQMVLLDYDGKRILRATPGGDVVTAVEHLPFTHAVALAIDGEGNFIIGDNGEDAIFRVTPSGESTLVAKLPYCGSLNDLAITIDDSGDYIVAPGCGPNPLLKVRSSGKVTQIGTDPSQMGESITSVAISPAWHPAGAGFFLTGYHEVFHVTRDGEVTTIANGFPEVLTGLTLGPSGDLFVVERNGQRWMSSIYQVSLDGSVVVSFQGNPLAHPREIVFLADQ